MRQERLTYSEAIEKVLLANNYVAPLRKIYKEIIKYRPLTGKTPFQTIQERVQRDPRFTRIGLGVYALTEYLDKLPTSPKPQSKEQGEEQTHYSIQGMLLEIGNMEGFDTYSPNKNAIFNNKPLLQIMTLSEFPLFTYPNIIQSVRFIDVLWFNDRGFPKSAFEVEITPQFRNSLVKFGELCDFHASFYLIADAKYYDKYENEISRVVFKEIKERCLFTTVEQVTDMYLKSIEKQKVSAEFFK
ncbi:MAG: hypothetical protein OEZ07_01260 [Dehalococcoidia bacterium]|nr:hypothetical protein [Dehalococcoidia bacterium]MDH5781185.1 hypothetical protein [Dehalococcoidia bacterium]